LIENLIQFLRLVQSLVVVVGQKSLSRSCEWASFEVLWRKRGEVHFSMRTEHALIFLSFTNIGHFGGNLTIPQQMEMPSVVCLRKYIKVSPKTPPLNRFD
jgi:hypothetical protein